jgi:hypothetical protein
MNDEDLTTAKVDGQLLHGRGTFDITAIDDVEIVIKHDEPRAQGAHPRGQVFVTDKRVST